jgi:hypothetical protein
VLSGPLRRSDDVAATWYCRVDDDELGPLPPAALKQLVLEGRVTADSLIRQGENGKWVPAGKVKGLLSGDSGSALQHDSAQLVGAASGSSKSAAKAAKPAQKLPQAKGAKPAAAAPAPAAARPAAPKPAVRNSDSSVIAGNTPAASAKSGGSELLSGRRRKQSVLPLIITLVVLVLLVVGAGIFAIVSYVLHSVQEGVAHVTDILENVPASGTNPTDGGGSGNTKPVPEAGIGRPTASESPDDYRRRVVRSIEQWRPALNRVGGTKKMKVRVDAVWLGSDTSARNLSPPIAPPGSSLCAWSSTTPRPLKNSIMQAGTRATCRTRRF